MSDKKKSKNEAYPKRVKFISGENTEFRARSTLSRGYGRLIESGQGEVLREHRTVYEPAQNARLKMLCTDYSVIEGITFKGNYPKKPSEIAENRWPQGTAWFKSDERDGAPYSSLEMLEIYRNAKPGEDDELAYRSATVDHNSRITCRGKIAGDDRQIRLFGTDRIIEFIYVTFHTQKDPTEVQVNGFKPMSPDELEIGPIPDSSLHEQLSISIGMAKENFDWLIEKLTARSHFLMLELDVSNVYGFFTEVKTRHHWAEPESDIKILAFGDSISNQDEIPETFWQEFDSVAKTSLYFVQRDWPVLRGHGNSEEGFPENGFLEPTKGVASEDIDTEDQDQSTKDKAFYFLKLKRMEELQSIIAISLWALVFLSVVSILVNWFN